MTDDEIMDFAKGMSPHIDKCVAKATGAFAQRLSTVENGIAVSPELNAEIASVVRLLHESSPVEQNHQPITSQRIIRVERDDQGNFITIYGKP